MFTVDSNILRLAEASIDPVWRHQRQEIHLDPIAAGEIFADYADELADDEHTEIIRLDLVRGCRTAPSNLNTGESMRYHFDDILRLAIPAEDANARRIIERQVMGFERRFESSQ